MIPLDWSATASVALAVLTADDGVAHISSFLGAGLTRHQVAALLRHGALVRPRIGWYTDPVLPHDAVRAIWVGGALGAVSAARSYGLPLPEEAPIGLFVSLAGNASRLRHSRHRTSRVVAGAESDVRWVWTDRLEAVRGYRVAVVDALLQLSAFVPFEWLVAAMDKALHVPRGGSPMVSAASWNALRSALPKSMRRAWELADSRSESPIETLLRLGLTRLGIAFELQVWMLPYHRVDFLIGGWLIIEVDGKRYHVGEEQFEIDRERDALFAAWGYRVLRFSYRQVVEDLDWVLQVIQSVVLRGSGRIA